MFLIFWDDYHIDRMASALRSREALSTFVLTAFGPTDLVGVMEPMTPLDAIEFTRDRRKLAQQVRSLQGRRGVYVPPRNGAEEAHLSAMRDIERLRHEEARLIPPGMDFSQVPGLSNELKQKMKQRMPRSVADAQRMDGMTPAALAIIVAHVRNNEVAAQKGAA